jgi:catechol 2,3-dioxygenase-like lactoylglutathione lyase family enzyme
VFDHVLVRVTDRAASDRFYAAVLEPLRIDTFEPLPGITRWDNLGITETDAEHPVTRGLHVGFAAASRQHVDAFWAAGTQSGYRDAGTPGPRPEYGEDYYGAFVLDPDGNSVEAVHLGDLPSQGAIDHLWIRVSDVPAARDFYAAIAPQTGFRLATDTPERAMFRGDSGTFSVVAGPATEHLHVAFSGPDDATVRDFHAAATTAGYPDNGPPGGRPVYGPDYYGAFVLDPDGNNVEVVHFNG